MRLSEVLSMVKYDGWELGFKAGLKEARRKMRSVAKIEGGAVVQRDYAITLRRQDKDIEATSMFDRLGSEVFDPTEAVEIESDGQLLELVEGDVLTITVEV